MTIHIQNGSLDTSISRRGFVVGTAGLTFAFTLGGLGRGIEALGAAQATKMNAWVSIAADNTTSRQRPTGPRNMASTCTCRAWFTHRCWRRRWKAPKPKSSTCPM